jgi:aminopeptidase N
MYRDADGAEHVIATTQMQSTDCRRAFPCWDEPDFKAVFAVTLVVEPDCSPCRTAARSSAPIATARSPSASPTRW